MRDFTIDLIWTKVQVAVTALGGWFGYFIGGVDGFMTALIILMALDYITGIMCAIVDKKLSSSIGFKGHLQEDADHHAGGRGAHCRPECGRLPRSPAQRSDLLLPVQ